MKKQRSSSSMKKNKPEGSIKVSHMRNLRVAVKRDWQLYLLLGIALAFVIIVCIMGLKPSPSGETFRSTLSFNLENRKREILNLR